MFTARSASNFVVSAGTTGAFEGIFESLIRESAANPMSCVKDFSFPRILSQYEDGAFNEKTSVTASSGDCIKSEGFMENNAGKSTRSCIIIPFFMKSEPVANV